jgi:hypothetical protein
VSYLRVPKFSHKSGLELAAMRTGWSIILASNIPSNAPVLEVFALRIVHLRPPCSGF